MYTGMSQHHVQPAPATGRRVWAVELRAPLPQLGQAQGRAWEAAPHSRAPHQVLLTGLLSRSQQECVCHRAFSSLSQLFLNVCLFVLH